MSKAIKANRSKPGILYVLLFELEGKSLVKIGVTHRSIEDRVSEILVAIFKKYREFPYCNPRRFRTTSDVYQKEKSLHKHFSDHSHTLSKKFGGSTEFFDIHVDEVIKAYDKMVPDNKSKKKKKGVFFTASRNV